MLHGAEEMEKQFLVRLNDLSAEWERERAALQQEISTLRAGGASGGAGQQLITVRPVSPQKTSHEQTQSLASLPRPKPGARELSLKQLLTFIDELYESKAKFDVKCREARLPRETMEQHLYTYLNQKYGLKSLIIEWASAVMAAVKRFSEQDNDVAVFGKILRNEIDEEFKIIQRQLKDTVADLLRVYLKGRHPLKSEDEVGKLLQKRIKSFVFEDEWTDIIKYMYNPEDSVHLIVKCKEFISARASNTSSTCTRTSTTRCASSSSSPTSPFSSTSSTPWLPRSTSSSRERSPATRRQERATRAPKIQCVLHPSWIKP